VLSTDSFLTYENIKVGGLYNFVIFFNNILVKQDICVCVYIAGQTAGPIGLKFFVDTQGWPRNFFSNIFLKKMFSFFHGQRRAFRLVSNKLSM